MRPGSPAALPRVRNGSQRSATSRNGSQPAAEPPGSLHCCYTQIIQPQPHAIPATNPQLSYYAAHPADTPIARVAILPGYGDHAGRYQHLMRWFAERNIASCAIDFRGHGRSAGKPGFVRKWDEHLTDLAAFLAIDELSTTNPTPLFILAHSHGGLIATIAAATGMLDRCRGVILSAPYLGLKLPIPLHKRFVGKIAEMIHPSMQIKSGMNGNMLTRDPAMIADSKADPFCRGIATPGWYFSALKIQLKARAMAPQFKLPLLMLVPGQDSIANPAASVDFFQRCASTDKTILHYPEHRHELLRELEREEIFQTVMAWIQSRSVSAMGV